MQEDAAFIQLLDKQLISIDHFVISNTSGLHLSFSMGASVQRDIKVLDRNAAWQMLLMKRAQTFLPIFNIPADQLLSRPYLTTYS